MEWKEPEQWTLDSSGRHLHEHWILEHFFKYLNIIPHGWVYSATNLDSVLLCVALITLQTLQVGSFLFPTLSFLSLFHSSDCQPPEPWVMHELTVSPAYSHFSCSLHWKALWVCCLRSQTWSPLASSLFFFCQIKKIKSREIQWLSQCYIVGQWKGGYLPLQLHCSSHHVLIGLCISQNYWVLTTHKALHYVWKYKGQLKR